MFEGAALQRPKSTADRSSDTATSAAADTVVPAATAVAAAAAEGGKDGRWAQEEGAGAESLVELAERLLRRADGMDRELDNVREALTKAR